MFDVNSTALNFFSSYLSDRTQSVLIKSVSATPVTISSGVPQGSVLGSMLVTLYTTALSPFLTNLSLPFHLYADVTQLYSPFASQDSIPALNVLSSALSQVHSWFNSNLTLNPSKTEFLLVGSPQ